MPGATYDQRRGQIEAYFDRTAAQAWARLTSEAPVGRIRATVRAGRDRMRELLLGWLPADLHGRRILDAGCGTGTLAVELARRGAEVVAIDLSRTLVDIARTRIPAELQQAPIRFVVGDMTDASLGEFDHVVAMDSVIHYHPGDAERILSGVAARTRESVIFTFVPGNPALAAMHAIGRLFPRGNRAPSVEPISRDVFLRRLAVTPDLAEWRVDADQRVSSGFYKSHAVRLARA